MAKSKKVRDMLKEPEAKSDDCRLFTRIDAGINSQLETVVAKEGTAEKKMTKRRVVETALVLLFEKYEKESA